MIRIGFGNDNKNNIIMDSKFQNNIKNAKEVGLKVGLYFYSYAKSEKEAINQAKWIIKELNGQSLDLPIAFDWESWTYFDDYQINFLESIISQKPLWTNALKTVMKVCFTAV